MNATERKFLNPSKELSVICDFTKNSSNLTTDYEDFFIGNRLKSRKVFISLFNFNLIPPIVGIILSNRAGISILTYEYNDKNNNRYGSIESYLDEDQDDLSEFISMYLSSLISFAENVKIENLRHVGIGGSNIKIKVFFEEKNYMIIVFLNANTDLSLRIQDHILDHFNQIFENYDYILENYNYKESIQIRKDLESTGQDWLKRLNRFYIKAYENIYIAKDVKLGKFMANIKPIVNETVEYYMKRVSEDIKADICREIHEKINNKLSEYF